MPTGRRSRWHFVAVPLGTLIAWQCAAPPRPQFHGDVKTVSADSLRAYIASLQFDSNPPNAQRDLVDFVTWRVGPGGDSAFIEPESHVRRLTMDELAEGRIIARVRTRTPYPPAGFGPTWWTYWWVDARDSLGRYRSVLIALHDRVDFRQTRRLTFKHHGVTPEYPALSARFEKDDDGLWGRCNSSCCATSTAAADTVAF